MTNKGTTGREEFADEQAAFEDWYATTRPSGDAESVNRQWEQSSELKDFLATHPTTEKKDAGNE